ncbi:DUF6878 family protein [Steroidobacter sp.]|uniref:DUF6878 family protein n=1 Tax=Steroidobacter sp. TaxID=1978227 RepID=UPI001A4EFEE1|nr:DUF6878 family protein [Steroidobacter sp.]MBL8270953.1 hypothetical protein [Steroidobacter sp.]
MSEEVINTVLDATELAGSSSKALGFAVSLMHLQAKGVPVSDVIQMARAQGRKIRLDWSERRWRDEHDRLARAETLKRLTAQNDSYDVAKFEAHLPPRFRGYLIRTSRRLGMEGLRQRHCIAGESYHALLIAGYVAIACVFVDRRRWTVQLALSSNPEAPLRITQIRTRWNAEPSSEVVEAIHRELGIERMSTVERMIDRPARTYVYMDNLRRVLPVLRGHGLHHIRVTFDGSGDEGAIEFVNFEDRAFDPANVFVEVDMQRDQWVNGELTTTRVLELTDLDGAIRAITDDYLQETGVDWWNGDGGYGELEIDVDAGTVSLEVSVRFTESSVQFARERDIATGEAVD